MSIVEVFPAPLGPRKAITSPEPMARATPRTACTEPKLLCTPRRSTASGGTARSWRPGSAARSASSRAICMAPPVGLASDPGFLLIPAAFAAPPPWGERARTHLAQCGDPDRQEQHNDHENQLNTHPDTSWCAELLRRGVGLRGATIQRGRPARTRRLVDQSAKPALPGSGATLPVAAQTALSRDQHGYGNICRIATHPTSGHIAFR